MLNDYAEAQVEAIEAHGGHVLKFIGDGLLAIFPDSDESNACERALDAAAEARRRLDALNERRGGATGLPVSDAHIALHIGELLYGNVGEPASARLHRARRRGQRGGAHRGAVRLARPARDRVERVRAGGRRRVRARLVSLGRYAMKGVARPQELYTLDPG